MFAWSGSTQTRVSANAVFAYLADPRHADQWFADIHLVEVSLGPLHVGQTWRFQASGPRGKPMAQVIRIVSFDPPNRFVWETAKPRMGTTLVWELQCVSGTPAGTALTLRTHWRVSLLGWPQAILGAFIGRRTLPTRAQRTVEHAREAVEAAYPAPSTMPASKDTPSSRAAPASRTRSSRRQRSSR